MKTSELSKQMKNSTPLYDVEVLEIKKGFQINSHRILPVHSNVKCALISQYYTCIRK